MTTLNRRTLIAAGAASLALPAGAQTRVEAHRPPRLVQLGTSLTPGTIHVVPDDFALYLALPDNQAILYHVGVAAPGRWRTGTFTIARKVEWPRWTPTAGMLRREPALYRPWANGIPGGHPRNPMGACALYLYDGSRDTLLRIHGSPPNRRVTGRYLSNGCVQMLNAEALDLYNRVPVGTRVRLR
ncbi:L,D-transpeptidase [Pseudooctadecabacter sp.]|uniref:L,D-transpeptidase n=1 Tax=Pseudooctadecabacter sp. TaxID=1966338 RepID=UPI0025E8F560|nr:L,D-transpeptidase [Pseudooctadecabacter sp.]